MMDFIDKIANNDLVLTSLVCLLVVLVIIFFLVLFFGGKKGKNITVESNNDNDLNNNHNVNFNHDEYIKETTAEFELAPVEEASLVEENEQLNNAEESPAFNFQNNSDSLADGKLNNFSFDELSKMINEELTKINAESQKDDTSNKSSTDINEIPEVKFVDTFKETEPQIKSVEVENVDNITNVFEKTEDVESNPTFINKKIDEPKSDSIVLPKLSKEVLEKAFPSKATNITDEEENTPLYARFNQESYDINKED